MYAIFFYFYFVMFNQINLIPFVELGNAQNDCSCRSRLYTWSAKPNKYLKNWLRKGSVRTVRSVVQTHADPTADCLCLGKSMAGP